MKHYTFISFLFLTLVYLVSCKSHQSEENKIVTDFYSVIEIPDSLLTVKQDSLKRELVDVMINHLEYKDDKIVFLMTKGEFVKKGFAPEYYDIIINDINLNNNIRRKSDGIDWQKLFNDKIREYKNNKQSSINTKKR